MTSTSDTWHSAARRGDLAELQRLLKLDASLISSSDSGGRTVLHHLAACEAAQPALTCLSFLCNSPGVNLDAVNEKSGLTPLMRAVLSDSRSFAVALVDAGANPLLTTSKESRSAADMARDDVFRAALLHAAGAVERVVEWADATEAVERESSRPDLAILCYPVISLLEFAHAGSRKNLLGDKPDPELVKFLSAELQVTKDTPPCFLWHTVEDKTVPVENTLMFAAALRRAGGLPSVHIYEKGAHGLGLGRPTKPAPPWADQCLYWLQERKFIP
jgi:hypothetical protein